MEENKMKFGIFGAKTKAPKVPKPAGKKPFSSRTVIGAVCILLALLITFGVAPLVNRYTERKVDIVRLKTDVPRGQMITAEQIEIVSVGAYHLPDHVIKDGKAVVGKYAATDLYAGDYLFDSKLSDESRRAEDVLLSLDGTKVAVSVSIADFAAGLSDKLENGDIVSAIIYDQENNRSFIPAALRYVQIITATTSDGIDKDKDTDGGQAATVTVLVTPEQAELLAFYHSTTTIHFLLVYRGDSAKAAEFIRVQDEYLKANPIDCSKTEPEDTVNG